MALIEKGSNLKPTYRSMPPNIFLSISYSLLNLFDGAILLQDERLLVNQLEQLIQQFSRLAGLAKTKSAKLMLTEQGIFSAKQSANIQQITPLDDRLVDCGQIVSPAPFSFSIPQRSRKPQQVASFPCCYFSTKSIQLLLSNKQANSKFDLLSHLLTSVNLFSCSLVKSHCACN